MNRSVVLAGGALTAGSHHAALEVPRFSDGFIDASHRVAEGRDTASELEWLDAQGPSVGAEVRSDTGGRGVVVQRAACLGRINGAVNHVQTEVMPGTPFERSAENRVAKFDSSGLGSRHWLKAGLGGWSYEFLERFALDRGGFIP